MLGIKIGVGSLASVPSLFSSAPLSDVGSVPLSEVSSAVIGLPLSSRSGLPFGSRASPEDVALFSSPDAGAGALGSIETVNTISNESPTLSAPVLVTND